MKGEMRPNLGLRKNLRSRLEKALRHNLDLRKERSIEGHEEGYGFYDLSLGNFGASFDDVFPNDHSRPVEDQFKKYIQNTLLENTEGGKDFTAVEFGGPGSMLFQGFDPNFFRRTIGVCLTDIRTPKQKETDTAHSHSVITGDITEVMLAEVLRKVREELGSTGTDLIICRMIGGQIGIDHHPAILDKIIRSWYEMLNYNGMIFAQFNSYQNNAVRPDLWVKFLKERFPSIEITINNKTGRENLKNDMALYSLDTIRLHKKEGAPARLPTGTQLFRGTPNKKSP